MTVGEQRPQPNRTDGEPARRLPDRSPYLLRSGTVWVHAASMGMGMGIPPRLVTVALALSLSACGSQSASVAADGDPSAKARLLAAADAAANRNGGKAKRVEAVETTRGKAADLTGHSNQNQNESVWVVQVSGDHYLCDLCSVPYGAKAPQGDYITIVLRSSDFENTDSGLGSQATDLAALGEVKVLRGDR